SPTAGCLVRRSAFTGPATPQLSNTQAGAYAQDTWSMSRYFVFQVGLRTDWDRFTQSAMAEPRVSANVLPFGDDRAKVSLGWGIYNGPLNLAKPWRGRDRKSTRLNSSHVAISYAVFCLKKKK